MGTWPSTTGTPGPGGPPTTPPPPAPSPNPRSDMLIRWGADNYDMFIANAGGTSFSLQPDLFGANVGTEGPIQLADFNGDGVDDLLLTQPNEYHIFIRSGSTFAPYWNVFGGTIGTTPEPPHLADYNGDGRTDMLIRWGTDNYDLFLANAGGTTFTQVPDIFGPNVGTESPMHLGDFNGDGKTDFMLIQSSGQYHVFISTGSSFTANWNIFGGTVGATPEAPHFNDYNGDGRTDMLIRWGTDNYDLYIANPNGNIFAGYGDIFGPNVGTESPIWFGDFNGDAKTDFMLTQPNQYHVFIATGSSFTPSWNVFGGTIGTLLEKPTFGDFNGDSRTDMLLRWNNQYDMFLANGGGTSFTGNPNIFGGTIGSATQLPLVGEFG
jgi:hypothetical protein